MDSAVLLWGEWLRCWEKRSQQEAEPPIRKIFGLRAAAFQQHTGFRTGAQQGCGWIFQRSLGPGESPCAHVRSLSLCFSICLVTGPMRGQGHPEAVVAISKDLDFKYFESARNLSRFFRGQLFSFSETAGNTNNSQSIYVFRRPWESCGKKRSAWWTAFEVDTSNLGRGMCFGAGW